MMQNGTARYLMTGAIPGIAIAVFVALAWPTFYAPRLGPQYRAAVASDSLPHEFNASSLAREHVVIAFVLCGVIAGLVSRGGVRSLILLWVGLWVSLLVAATVWPAMRNSNLAPLALIVYPVEALAFLLPAILARSIKLRAGTQQRHPEPAERGEGSQVT